MHYADFCYWLQGYVEMGGDAPNAKQWQMIKEHLALVFNKITPTPWSDKDVHQKVPSDRAAAKNAVDDAIKAMKRSDPIPHPPIVKLPFDDKYTLTSHLDYSGRNLAHLTPQC